MPMPGGEGGRERQLAPGEAVSSAHLEHRCWGKRARVGAESQVGAADGGFYK